MRWTIMLAAAAALGLGSGAAQAQSPDMLQVFTRADFEQALRDAGASITSTERSNPRIKFTFEGDVQADALLLACEDEATQTNCYGSSILATFAPDDSATPEQIANAINTYNNNENFGRAYLDNEGTVSVRMYIISDGGITRANYSRQIGLWFASVVAFFDYLYPEAAK
jgi:hypothetical protein